MTVGYYHNCHLFECVFDSGPGGKLCIHALQVQRAVTEGTEATDFISRTLFIVEVEGAKCHENQFHVRVYEHKTTVKYGAAVLVVSAREHGWLLRFSALRATLPGYNRQPATFFFTSGGKPIANMGLLLSKAWRACGIGEWVTAGMIRSAVATYTWSTHGEVSKTTVSRHMTHSLQTQAAFYVLDGAPANHQQARRLIEQSLDICESDSPESPEMASA
ncbi:UNVERIFIED_CONTAM: hypothetical protein FKN15_078423 [Acipenser sinensis]